MAVSMQGVSALALALADAIEARPTPSRRCDWRETRKSKMKITETPRGTGAVVRWSFVKCATCKCVGFRRDKSAVVFTWQQKGQCDGQPIAA